MFLARKAQYTSVEAARNSKLIVYITGDRPGMETKISGEVYDRFVNHLDKIGVVPRISLFLYTRGGDTLAAWSLVNLIRQFCDELELIIPSKAHSAGTLMALGANKIVMTKQATLGPIDPSLTSPLNPQIPGGAPDSRAAVSVEAVNGYLELAKVDLAIKGDANLTTILTHLSDRIHPLVLGSVFRSKAQIQMLARKLILAQLKDEDAIKKVIGFLCSESGSHDYTIHRREARDGLGLNIEKPSAEFYALVKSIYDDIVTELALDYRFDVRSAMAGSPTLDYSFRRALIESVAGGCEVFVTEGTFTQKSNPAGMFQVEDNRKFEGWRHEN